MKDTCQQGFIKRMLVACITILALLEIPLNIAAQELELVSSYADNQDNLAVLEEIGHELSLSPDGRYLYVTGGHLAFSDQPEKGALIVFERDQNTGRLTHLQSLIHGTDVLQMVEPTGVVVSPDGEFVYVATTKGRYLVFLRDQYTGLLSEIESNETEIFNPSIAISPDGNSIYIGGLEDLSSFRRTVDGTLTPIIDSETSKYEVENIAISPDGLHVYIAGSRCDGITVCNHRIFGLEIMSRDESTGALTSVTTIERQELDLINRMAISPDGKYIYVGGSGITTFTRNLEDGHLLFLTYLPGMGVGNSKKMFIRGDGARLFSNGILFDSSNPVALKVIDDIFGEVAESPTGEAINHDFRHIYTIGHNTKTDRNSLSLLNFSNDPIYSIGHNTEAERNSLNFLKNADDPITNTNNDSDNRSDLLKNIQANNMPARHTITNNGSMTTAVIFGGVTSDNGNTYTENFTVGDTIKIFALLAPKPNEIGEDAKVFVVFSNGTNFFQITPAGIINFDGTLAGLVAFNEINLTANNEVHIFSILGGEITLTASQIGSFFIHVGYSTGNGILTFNSEAINFQVSGLTTPNPDPTSNIVDKNNGIDFHVRPVSGQDNAVSITWSVSNSVVASGSQVYIIQFYVGGGQQWQDQVETDEITDNGIPIFFGVVPDDFCFRMIATATGSYNDPIMGSGTSGNESPCL